MATNHSDTPLDPMAAAQDPDPDHVPGIAHLTVVPRNADESA